jgi:hypothetical protein
MDALFEVGRKRQQILMKLREAVEKRDLKTLLQYAGQLVGLDEKMEEPHEKGH